ncbi:hypothetical protein [Kordia sp.]|uniref:hypothetical protein n=1 Tax=Kordia sp. TaxID=1965332 RepID=UPI003B594452
MKSIPAWNPVAIKDIVGTYKISGVNQDIHRTTYAGILHLSLNENERVIARWSIGNDSQIMHGIGFYKDNILVINFQYEATNAKVFKGVVVYRVLNSNILDGFWSEKHGDQKFLGEEQCLRINTVYAIN